MKYLITLSLAVISIFLVNCAHTNNLYKYNLSSKVIYFEELVTTNASRVEIKYMETESTGNKNIDIIKDIAVDIAGAVLASEAEEKLQKAANPNDIVVSVSSGVESGLVRYLKVKPTSTLDDDSDYIVMTILEDCKLVSSTSGIYISITASTTITSRNTGALVWEYSSRRSSPIRYSRRNSSGSVAAVLQATELAMLTEEQMKAAINAAANKVGYAIGDILREDIADSVE